MRESDEPLTDTLVRCLADPTDLKALERLENDGDQAGARLMRARLADQAALRLDAALEDNRARVRRQLGRDWAWATDEVMSDLTIRTIRRLDYWHRTNTDRAEGGATSLAAFVNQLTGTVVGEWFKTQRPKHRTGMTQTPERRAGRLKPPTDGVGTVAPARADPRRLRRDLRRIRHLRGTRRRRREPRIARRGRPGKLPAMGRRHGGRPIAGQRRIQDGHGGPRPRGPGRMGTRRMETDPDPMHDLEPRPSPAQGDPPLARSPPQRDHPETGPLPLPQGMRRHRRP